jgi:hypothetical protein
MRPVPSYVRALAMGIPAYLIGVHLWTWVFMLPVFLGGRSDFRQLYTAGYMVRTGHRTELYDYEAQLRFQNRIVSQNHVPLPFIRPAFEALLFVPLSLVSYRQAYFAFLLFNCALLAVCYRLVVSRLKALSDVFWWLPGALFLAFLPIAAALMQGQDSIVLLVLLVLALNRLEESSLFAAGALIGMGLFKFQIVIPLVLILAIWRYWKVVIGFTSTSSVLCAASLWVAGFRCPGDYMESLRHLKYPLALTLMTNIHGLTAGVFGTIAKPIVITGITVLASIGLFAFVARRKPETEAEAFSLAIVLSALCSYYLLIHDMSVLTIPVFIALSQNVEHEGTGDKIGQWRFRLAALVLIAPLLISFSPEHFYLVALPVLGFGCLLCVSIAGSKGAQHCLKAT